MHYIQSTLLALVLGASISCDNRSDGAIQHADVADSTPASEAAVDSVPAPEPTPEIPDISYTFYQKKEWLGLKDSFEGRQHMDILIAINRTDSAHIKRLDSILVPNRYDLPLHAYLPFPQEVSLLKDVKKIIIFSNPTQTFAAYENGKLVRQGQTNMGKKATPTPPKLYFCNWKARRTTSTVNSSWILNWNFNVSNFGGIGFHQYALPGYPASHSCMRLQEADAYFLYHWAEQWILKGDAELAKGTPVLVHGQYPFGSPRPWYALVDDPQALSLNQDSLRNMLEPHLPEILKQQQRRDSVMAERNAIAAVQDTEASTP